MSKIVFTFGRMNPPTIGHQKLADKVKSVAKAQGADVRIYLSHTQNNKKDPLDYASKLRYAQKAFGRAVYKSNAKTVIQIVQEIEKAGYKELTMVVGSDRVTEFNRLLQKYNGKDYTFDSIKVVSAGARDPDAQGVEGMSASKLRAVAKDGDFETFKKGMAAGLSDRDAKEIFDTINNELSEEALSIQQRLARGRVMKRNAKKLARIRKMKSKRRATPDALKNRARKQAIKMVRKKVAGDRGKNYANLSSSEKQNIDKLVAKKKQMVDRIAKKLINKVRKSETERLSKARSRKEEFVIEAPEDKDIGHKKGSQPAKYHSGLAKSTKDKRDSQFQKGAKKHHSDPSAYPEKHAGDDGVKTKMSKHTKKYRAMFGESDAQQRAKEKIEKEKESDKAKHDRLMDRARLRDAQKKNRETTTESFEITESAMASLRKKADKSGIPVGILKKVYDRGMAAWRTGHRPGASQEQWAFARVNSFITKGSGTWGKADKDLAAKVRKEETQLDELSPRTKASYLKKASDQNKKVQKAYDKSVKSSPDAFFGVDSPKDQERMKTMTKRQKGMAMAKGRKYGQKYEEAKTTRTSSQLAIRDTNRRFDRAKKTANKDDDNSKYRTSKSGNVFVGLKKEEVGESATPMRNLKLINKIKKSGTVKTGSMSNKKEACWSDYKQVGMKKKGDKMVPNCVPEAKNAAQQAAIAIAKKEKLKESGGAGEYGTNKLRKKYSKETPMERVDPKAAMMDKAVDALHRRANSKGDKESLSSYAFDVARSFQGVGAKELLKAYQDKYK